MTARPLDGKTVIMFCPRFFGYELEIQRELAALGADVVIQSDRPSEAAWAKALIRLVPWLGRIWADRHFSRWLRSSAPDRCDLILVIKGEAVSPGFLRGLRARYPRAYAVMYLFDSAKNYPMIDKQLGVVDEAFSFDMADCRTPSRSKLKYRPLFFLPKYLRTTVDGRARGLFFLGTLNGDRPAVLSRIGKALDARTHFDYWLYVRSRHELAVRALFDPSLRTLDRARLIFTPMSAETAVQRMSVCAAIVDIEHPNQTGLTMRTFEVLASGKKLITTNRGIMEHEFYDENRVCVVDRDAPAIPRGFLDAPVGPVSEEFIGKYSLRGWLMEVLSGFLLRDAAPSCPG